MGASGTAFVPLHFHHWNKLLRLKMSESYVMIWLESHTRLIYGQGFMHNLSHQILTTCTGSNIIPYFTNEETGSGRLCNLLSLSDFNTCTFFTVEPKPDNCLGYNSKFLIAMLFLVHLSDARDIFLMTWWHYRSGGFQKGCIFHLETRLGG